MLKINALIDSFWKLFLLPIVLYNSNFPTFLASFPGKMIQIYDPGFFCLGIYKKTPVH